MIICGNCEQRHAEVATVRACYAGDVFPCAWLVEDAYRDQDGFIERSLVECGAAAVGDERGWHCEAGHDHVNAETRAAEGWDYASDMEEAAGRAKYGHASVLADGKAFLG
jgi:hypothetical protein